MFTAPSITVSGVVVVQLMSALEDPPAELEAPPSELEAPSAEDALDWL
jgi:hypothetical protein